MSVSMAGKLVLYRSWVVAVTNAAVTWVILMFAPLGLFAMILCTGAVFFASLVVGEICDRLTLYHRRSHFIPTTTPTTARCDGS
ncbi:CRISPR-associated protein Csx18 [Anabaena azotica]|uniref:Uncharacterized protein n=1 Tax=Anabaena azotica FACHB-119 TaxID=947527 RepID=A0ABR8CZ65_9NOST|nr:CRISPR-associated protein Csx18 [Anabaena azotica]MBD2500132.1 hypothetical protein [Anabaena azotica FACHB-119]